MKKQSVIMGSFWLMTSVAVSKAAGLLLKIPLANLLGGTGMGYYSSAYAVFMPLYAICAGSLPPAIAQSVSESSAFGRFSKIRETKRVALLFFSAVSIILTLIPLLFAGFISERIIGNPEAKLSVMAISPCIFLGTVTAVYRGYYEGLKNMTPTAVSQMVDAIVKLLTGLGLAMAVSQYAKGLYLAGEPVFGTVCLNEYELNAASLPYIAAAAVMGTAFADLAAMLYLVLSSKHFSYGLPADAADNPISAARSQEILKGLLRVIAPIGLASLVASLLNTIDLSTIILMIKISLRKHPELYMEKYSQVVSSGVSLKELPNFLYGSFTGLSMAIFTLAPSLCAVFGKSAFPSISECFAKGEKAAVAREIRRALCLCTYMSIPAGLGLAVFSKPILSLLFSSRYAEISVSYIPLSVLAPSAAFLSVMASSHTMLQAIGRADLPVRISLVGAVIKLVLNTILIPFRQWGLAGASLATAISYFVICIWSVAALYKLTETRPRILISVILPTVCGLLASAGAFYVYNFFTSIAKTAVSLIISVLFAVIIYILLLVILDITNKNALSSQFFD